MARVEIAIADTAARTTTTVPTRQKKTIQGTITRSLRAGDVALRDVEVGAVVVEVEGAVEATGQSQVVAHPTAKMPTITENPRGWSSLDSHEMVTKAGLAL